METRICRRNRAHTDPRTTTPPVAVLPVKPLHILEEEGTSKRQPSKSPTPPHGGGRGGRGGERNASSGASQRSVPHRQRDEGSDQNPSSASAAQQRAETISSPRENEDKWQRRRGRSLYGGRLFAHAVFSAARGGRAWLGRSRLVLSSAGCCDPPSG